MVDIDLQRRQMLKGITALTGSALLPSSMSRAETQSARIQNATAEGEFDWEEIRASFPEQKPFLNLDNGCIGPPSLAVQEKVIDSFRYENCSPCYNMFDVIDKGVPQIKAKLAQLADCDPREIALNRNTTVGMCTAILGMPLSKGDEVLLSNWDYPSMINAWKQRAARDGIVLKSVSFGLMDSDEKIVEAYSKAITAKTKAIQLTHIIHWSGRAIPVAEICAVAKGKDILTVVDAAQSFAHIPVSFREIGCDYLATSFHKWLSAPIGTGMFVIKADRIEETWPLFPIYEELDGADKFGMSNLGTYDSGKYDAIGDAVDFHNRIGSRRKQERLQSLSKYWVEQALEIPGFNIHTPMDHPELGGITLFSIDGIPINILETRLREEFGIQTRKRDPKGLRGIRVSPQVYVRKSELDTLVSAIRAIARSA